MRHAYLAALALGSSVVPAAAQAQIATPIVQTMSGTRLDVSAVGEVTRVPDVAIISAGVMTRSASATEAIAENAARMERVRAALKRAGIADRDVQTSSISLNPEYRYQDNQPPQLTGYTASNQVSVRFRDIRNTGRILDALVAEGANQINGPSLTIDKPEAALDEARAKAIAAGRARAELYARALGMRVVRLLSVSEGGGQSGPQPMVMMRAEGRAVGAADSKIDPGEQQLSVTLAMTFELQ
ncbi:MAG: SIMPL domain-containing protein [Sphingomicrobium sp.]